MPSTRTKRRKPIRTEAAAPPAAAKTQELVLDQLEVAARFCRKVEQQLGTLTAPELDVLIKVHRVLVLKLSLEAEADPRLVGLVKDLMKPVLDYARLEELRRTRELAERKYADRCAAEEAARQRECQRGAGGLRPETVDRIERELNLF
jgi:hypothetical protein